ncbi:MAG: alcohol dehydrogenase [Sphingobacteriales bacterium]|nr:MAG: alcohol dehydrogenase [Sphingobacteriales bacterium]
MKAVVLNGVKQPLNLIETQLPTLLNGQVLVQIKAAAINRRDWWIKEGKYAGLKFPIILGSDGAGIVHSVGGGVDNEWIGQEVIINPSLNWGDNESFQGPKFEILGLPQNGTFAQFVALDIAQVYKKPTFLSFEQAAAIPLSGLTAFRALFPKANLQKEQTVLIAGAGGGTATFALLFAVAFGANVYVTAGNKQKVGKAILMGAKGGVCYKDEDWDTQLLNLTNGFDVIIDSALGSGFAKYPTITKPGGRIVLFGGTAGNMPEINGRQIFWKQLQILGTTMGSPKDFEAMIAFVNQHQIKPIIDEVFDLAVADFAFKKMENYGQFGKMVLRIN